MRVMTMDRYLVIEVGCLECSQGDAAASVVLRTNSRAEAERAATKDDYSSEWDRFVLDVTTGDIISPNSNG